jgi:hypothetical protein
MRIHIIALGDSLEATTLRAVLESQSHQVSLSFVATPEQFFADCADAADRADVLVVSAHGDKAGFVFPELAEGVSAFALDEDILTPKMMQAQVTRVPRLVFSTACFTGQGELADIFLAAGASQFIGPHGEPEGADISLILGLLFRSQNAAVPIQQKLDRMETLLPDAAMFRCFERDQ